MESAYGENTITKLATKLFTETVFMYRNARKKYEELLKEAILMSDDKHNGEAAFMSWLSRKISPAQLSELYIVFQEIEQQATKTRIVKQSLYENANVDVFQNIRSNIEQGKVFRFIHKQQTEKINSALHYLIQYAQEITSNEGDLNKSVTDEMLVEETKKAAELAYNKADSKPQTSKKNDKDSFYQWMMNNQRMAVASCRSYVSAVSVAEQYAAEQLLVGTRLFCANVDEAKKTANALFADVDFVKKNEDQHNRFRAAIAK